MFDFSKDNLDREFPVRKNLVYLNHAALAPLPARVARAIQDHTTDVSSFGAVNWKRWYRQYDETREKAARLLGADASQIAFLPSTSHALNLVATGISWRTGDTVLGDDLEFPANVYPWMNLAEKGVEYRILQSRNGQVTAQDFLERIDPTTRVLAVSWVSFHSGFVYPLAELGKICEERNILLVVDAIQGLGTMPIDVKSLRIDVLAADSHKFLYGPEACAIFYFSEKAKRRIGTPWAGWWNVPWRESQLEYRANFFEGGRRFEPGSLPTAQIFGLAASLDLLSDVGMEAAQNRIGTLTSRLRAGLSELGWTIHTPEGSRSAILAAVPPAGSARDAIAKLEKEGIIAAPREGAVRFSPHVGNDETEIERVLETIRHG
ncbi:MAG: aminotransferase class V-fold PLP-dependent enzyme [Thermoanaerobaculia bacterium]